MTIEDYEDLLDDLNEELFHTSTNNKDARDVLNYRITCALAMIRQLRGRR